jgi:hypothetical protein
MNAPLRVLGIGGAYAGYAEGVDAIATNAAAAAQRAPYSTSWFDFDLSAGLLFPATLSGDDYDNDGRVDGSYDRFFDVTLGASVALGYFGAGVLGDFQQYRLRPSANDTAPQLSATLGRLHAVVGYTWLGGQVTGGGGLRFVTMSVDAGAQTLRTTNVLSMVGAAPEVSVLVRPDDHPWRIGFTYRAPVTGKAGPNQVVPTAQDLGFDPPSTVRLPWEIETGFALQAGPRPLNPRWLDPHEQLRRLRREVEDARAGRVAAQSTELTMIRDPADRERRGTALADEERVIRKHEDERLEGADGQLARERRARQQNWPRARITVLGEVLITGRSQDAASLTSLFEGAPKASGQSVTWSPRLGLEGEPVIDALQIRTGTYIEPSRYDDGRSRQHFTFGFDVRLAAWSLFGLAGDQIWRLTGVMDLAPLYQSFGLSVGAWH